VYKVHIIAMRRVFTLADAAEIAAAPYVARAFLGDAVRTAAHLREAWGARGTSAHLEPPPQRTPDELKARGLAASRRAAAFADSPRGRFLSALRALERSRPAAAEAARAAFARGFADPDRVCVAEVGRALAVLGSLDGEEARGACRALSEILAAAVGLAAA